MLYFDSNIRTKNFKQAYPTNCQECKEDVYYHLRKEREWISVLPSTIISFKIPASRSKWWLVCPNCNTSVKLDEYGKETINAALDLCKFTQKYFKKEISEGEYKEKIEKFDKKLELNEK